MRFIAAFLVIIHHIEQLKYLFKLPNYWETIPFIEVIGYLGVVLFFVLSGFLITYLLLAEEHTFKTISVRKFYIRRMLRIWPLYFLIVFLAFFILPNISFFTLPGPEYTKEALHGGFLLKLLLYLVFLPNLAVSLIGTIPYAAQTWSIGAEEQYYLVWPVILKYFKKHKMVLMFCIIFLYVFVVKMTESNYTDFIPNKAVVKAFISSFNIDCMAIGGIYAILLFQKHRALKILLNNYFFYSVLLIVIALLIGGITIPYLNAECYALLFGIIILNFAANDKIKISLENKVLNYLGNISYGLYMYHSIGIVLTLVICRQLNFVSNWLLYLLSFIFTIILAGLSYKYFEMFFLKYKDMFSNIVSGNNNKE
ncbi:MAG TPA: acyltransferase [Bacteroidia bacterium]|nr:acyltransferase [Bacteroidia bacterium]